MSPDGEEKVIRYGMWGTNAEIERHGCQFHVVHEGKSKAKFKTLAEAEVFVRECFLKR